MNSLMSHTYFAATAKCGVLDDVFGRNLCQFGDFNDVIRKLAIVIVGIMGLILTVVILYAAVEIVTSAGSPDRIKSAKNRLLQAATSILLLVSLSSIVALLGVPSTPGGAGGFNSLFGGVNSSNINSFDGVKIVITNAAQILMMLVGALSVIFVVIGGIQYIISAGNGSGIENAKKTITYAVAGLLLALSATAIIQFVNKVFF